MSNVGVTQISGAIAVPPAPQYEDEDAERLGEELAELYARRQQNPRAAIDDLIEKTRRDLRRGPRLRAGEFLKDGRYRLIERLGENASDTTWKCWDRDEQKLVVVKEMVGPWVAQKMRVGAFLEAARTLSDLEHAGMARVLEATQSRDGFVYLVTDLFEGGRLDRFKGDATDVLQVVVEVANALGAAHEKDLVHGRINPPSIYFDMQGGARLVDFDLAGETTAQEQGSIYVAPEMVEKGARASATADVYALAMCAMFALNGNKLPYTVVRGPERVIQSLEVAESVKQVLLKAVDWDTEQRVSTMVELTDLLLADGDVLESLAERAWDRERFVIASEHYTRLWTLKPDDSVRIKTRLAEIYLAMSAWEEAYSCLAGALGEADDIEPLYPLLHRYAEGTQDFKRVADSLWNEARDRPPLRRSSMRAELATITEERLSDPQGAAEIWTLVLQDHRLPSRGEQALRALCRLAEDREDWESYVEHAQELLPHLAQDEAAQTEYGIGRALVKELGREDEGLGWIDRAEMNGVEPLDLADQLQDIRARRGQWRRVIKLMRLQADNEKKVHAASRILLRAATIARAVHLEEEAEAIYENMLARAPQHYPALRSLARMRHRSGRSDAAMAAYHTLTTNHYVGKSEEPEASERAADHTGYAMLLVDETRFDDAIVQLEAALQLQADNVEALRLAGPLYLDTGALEHGAQVLEKLYTLFKAVNSTGARLEAALQRADAAWFRGRLAVAMRWYNTALDTVPDNADAWWGLAKIAIAARGGHPGGDRAPWLVNVPEQFTPQEALARLLMGLFGAEALSEWLSLHPLGKGVADAGATPGRLACAGVDLLARYGLIHDALFERLREAYPDWQPRIDAVEGMFQAHDPDFAVERSYRWARSALDNDFDRKDRDVLSAGHPVQGILVVDFDADEHWQVLLSSPQPEEPPAPLPENTMPDSDAGTPPAVDFLLGDRAEFTLKSSVEAATIGSKRKQTWKVKGLDAQHATLRRVGHSVYVEKVGGSELAVDGVEVAGWRLMGGETLQLGSYLYDIRVRAGETEAAVLVDHDTAGLAEDEAVVTQRRRDPVPEEAEESEGPGPTEEVSQPETDDASEPDTEVVPAEADAEAPTVTAEEAPDALKADAPEDVQPEAEAVPEELEVPESEVAPEPEELEAEEAPEEAEEAPEELESEEAAEEPESEEAAEELEAEEAPDELEADAAPVLPDEADVPQESPVAAELPDAEEATLSTKRGMLNLAELVKDFDPADLAELPSEPDPSIEFPMEGDGDPEDAYPLSDDEPSIEAMTGEQPLPVLEAPVAPEPYVESEATEFDDAVEEEPEAATVADLSIRVPEADEASHEPVPDEPEAESPGWGDEEATVIQYSPLVSEEAPLDSLGPAADPPTPGHFGGGNDLDATVSAVVPAAALEPPAFALSGGGGWDDDSKAFAKPDPVPAAEEEPEPYDGPEVDAFLEVMSGPSRNTQVSIKGTVTVGRDDGCDLCIPGDSMLAPLHCRLIEREGTFLITDNATDRGTVVNGTRVTEAILMGGETIMAGVTVLRFQIHG